MMIGRQEGFEWADIFRLLCTPNTQKPYSSIYCSTDIDITHQINLGVKVVQGRIF